MKTLTNFTMSEANGKVTITADLIDKQFPKVPMQQTTLLHTAEGNPRWARHVQLFGHGADSALFVKRFRDGLALDLEQWITKVANVLEPKLASPPTGKIGRTPTALKAEIASELNPTFQWQHSDKMNTPNEQWRNIEGQTSDTLKVPDEIKGRWVRCFAQSAAGPVATPPVAV